MKKKQQYRQGDVFLVPVKLPMGAAKSPAKDGKIVLALGEATGHHHRIEVIDRPDVEAYEKDGVLYRVAQGDDEPVCMTRVLNSTPEPDGALTRDEARAIFGEAAYATEGHGPETRWKEYWEGVPPDMQTCAQAVAWGFGMTESEYAPVMET